RRYIDASEPENAARPRPATFLGTKGSSNEAPTAISPQLRNVANCSGVSLPSGGTPWAAMPCRPSAASAGRPSLPIPELRMNAPGTARRTAVLSDMGAPRDSLLSLSTIGDGSVDVDPRDDTGPMVAEHAPSARHRPAPR